MSGDTTPERKPIRGVLIHAICLFGARAATAARKANAELDG